MPGKKILFIGKGSDRDPGFEGLTIEGITYQNWMERKGIFVFEKEIVESCHGCPDLMNQYSEELQKRVDAGDRVVGIFSGGLYLALSSLQATQVTFPIISVPTDLVAYQAFMVPSGHAVVAGVGVDKGGQILNKEYETTQRVKALRLAQRILTLEFEEVCIVGDESNGKLEKKLLDFGIKYRTSSESHLLHLSYSKYDQKEVYPYVSCLIRADSDEDMNDWNYLRNSEQRNHIYDFGNPINTVPFAQVRGVDNLAIYAAKILSLQRHDLRQKLIDMKVGKRKTYEQRDLSSELAD
ncbi:MAG: hypothetical protein ABIH72_02295 [archaeon]